jgi:iron complex transport system substrate-binding protein
MYGASVTVPTRIDRIADGWPAHNSLLLMLGVANKLVATTPIVQAYPWFLRIDPGIASLPGVFGTTVNNEQLVQTKPDVVFLSQTDDNTVKSIRGLGLPLVQVYFTDFAQLEACFQLTGQVLGGDAPGRATQYVSYLDEHLAAVRARTAQLPPEQRPRVVHLSSLQPLMVDGRDTIIDQWIDAAGGRNAAHDDIVSNGKTVTFEQVLAWDPDVLILGGTVSQVQTMRIDPQWQQLRAVSTGRLYVNPKGVFPWDRYGPEEALQIQWAAQLLHPDLFTDLDLVKTTRDFYQNFFAYTLSDTDVQDILQPRA